MKTWRETREEQAEHNKTRWMNEARLLQSRIDKALEWLSTEGIHCEGPTCRLLRNHMDEACAALKGEE